MSESASKVACLSPVAMRIEGEGGVGINTWDFGGEGPNLMLVHCTGTHGRVWDPLIPALLEHFHVYSIDTRGHGDSDKPEDPDLYTWRLSGNDLVRVIEALGIGGDVRALGHSAGAAHVCYAALLKPGLISRMVVIDPIIGPDHAFSGENPLAIAARKRRKIFESREAAIANYASKPPMNAWDPLALEAYVRFGFRDLPDGTIELKCPPEVESELYNRGGAIDIFERLGEIDIPTTLITADKSNVRTLAELQNTLLSGHEFHILEGVSHFIPQEVPEEIVQIALDYLS